MSLKCFLPPMGKGIRDVSVTALPPSRQRLELRPVREATVNITQLQPLGRGPRLAGIPEPFAL
jgi:hypothetical protein